MELRLLNTERGLVPLYDEDFQNKMRLEKGKIYTATIKETRNARLHRKYFAARDLVWEYLPESARRRFKTADNFRKSCEVCAGWYDEFYSPKLKDWVQAPRSVSFLSAKESEFRELYDRVLDVYWSFIGERVTREDFERELANFF